MFPLPPRFFFGLSPEDFFPIHPEQMNDDDHTKTPCDHAYQGTGQQNQIVSLFWFSKPSMSQEGRCDKRILLDGQIKESQHIVFVQKPHDEMKGFSKQVGRPLHIPHRVIAKFIRPLVSLFLDIFKDIDAQPIISPPLIPSQKKEIYDQGANRADDGTPQISQPNHHDSPKRVIIEPTESTVDSPATHYLPCPPPVLRQEVDDDSADRQEDDQRKKLFHTYLLKFIVEELIPRTP